MRKERELKKYVVKQIQEKTVLLSSVNSSSDEREVPKYRLPLGIKEGETLTLSDFGMFEHPKEN